MGLLVLTQVSQASFATFAHPAKISCLETRLLPLPRFPSTDSLDLEALLLPIDLALCPAAYNKLARWLALSQSHPTSKLVKTPRR